MKPNTKVTITDSAGAEIQDVPAFYPKKQKNGFDAWCQVRCLPPCEGTIMNQFAGLTGESARVLLALLFTNGYRNKLQLTQTDLGRILGMPRQNVSRAFQKLVSAGFLVATMQDGKKSWLLSTDLAWRGRGNEHLKLLKK